MRTVTGLIKEILCMANEDPRYAKHDMANELLLLSQVYDGFSDIESRIEKHSTAIQRALDYVQCNFRSRLTLDMVAVSCKYIATFRHKGEDCHLFIDSETDAKARYSRHKAEI